MRKFNKLTEAFSYSYSDEFDCCDALLSRGGLAYLLEAFEFCSSLFDSCGLSPLNKFPNLDIARIEMLMKYIYLRQ
jgi:hypothetical protein